MDRQVRDFIWSGQEDDKRSWLDYNILLKSKQDDGSRLISIMDHTIATAMETLLSMVIEGEHTL